MFNRAGEVATTCQEAENTEQVAEKERQILGKFKTVLVRNGLTSTGKGKFFFPRKDSRQK